MNSKPVLIRMPILLGIVNLLFFAGCGGGTSQSSNNPPTPPPPPAPTITTISPNSAAASGAAFTLTINGTNFVAASIVQFAGTAPTTTFVSSTQLTAAIPAAAIASAGTAAVTVTNPAPGGGTSNAANFTINGGSNPVPTIISLDPGCAPVGAQGFNLQVSGTNFVAGSVVDWNGSARLTTVLSPSFATAQLTASDFAAAGTVTVTVANPSPGGGSSNSVTFTIAPGVGPQSIAIDPTGKFAYVADEGCPDFFDGNVSMYTIDATTGALTSVGPPVDSGDEGAHSVAVDPSGRFVYVANSGEGNTAGSISTYTINATTGALTSTGTIFGVCPGLCAPWSIAVDPSGKFSYVADEGGFAPTGVSIFAINVTTGALTSVGTITTGGRAVSVTMDPTGKFAYAADGSNGFPAESNNVTMYTVNATTGALTSVGTVAAGTDPVSVAVHPTGTFAYASNHGSNDVSMYSINAATGALTSIGTITAGSSPTSIAIHPSGKFAYVSNGQANSISMYTIDTTGALTSVGMIAAGLSPTSIAVHPSGKFAYVTNSGSNGVSMYSIDATTGALTLIGTVGT